ncbi:MAG: hypothetical protein ACK478_00525 [Flavobacteriales bacterium]
MKSVLKSASSQHWRYALLTLLSAWALSLCFFGSIWRTPNAFLFNPSGDGLQGYYQSIWHTHMDAASWEQSSMNYPFGESIFFTGGQPLLTNTIRLLKPLVDLSEYTVGISNLFILFSGVLASLFLFLALKRLQVRDVYASMYAVLMVLPAQQWDRTGGHFALAVLFAIPLMLWLFIGFFQAASERGEELWRWSAGIALSLFVLGLIQFYYLFFTAAIAGSMALVYFFIQLSIPRWKLLLHLSAQFVLPFIALQLLLALSTDVVDRTAIPWGFLVFRSSWLSYLFPYGMPYEKLFDWMKPEIGLEWEGLSYIGLGAMTLAISSLFGLFSGKMKRVESSPKRLMMALAVAALVCIAASMAFPFNWGFERLLYQLGAVQQFRGIGRFAMVAYYPLLILLIVAVNTTFKEKKVYPYITGLVLSLMAMDGYARLSQVASRIENPRGALFSSIGKGMEGIEANRYQAIHPLPYVHVGSENIGAVGSDEAMRMLYQTSLQTGLPTTAAVMSRTSVSQAFLSCALSWEIMEMPSLVEQFPDSRPLLVLADTANLHDADKQVLHFAKPLFNLNSIAFYELPVNAFDSVLSANAGRAEQRAQDCTRPLSEELWGDSLSQGCAYLDSSIQVTFSHGWKRLLELPVDAQLRDREVEISFWVENFRRDLIPRSVLEITQLAGEKSVDYQTEFLGKRLVGMRNGRALLAYRLRIKPDADVIRLAIENKLIQGTNLEINSILVRPEQANCRILHHGKESLNNRIYSR